MDFVRNHPIAPYTTVKIGGPAEYFIHSTSYHQFKTILESLKNKQITILGNGSNVLISDTGIKGYVIKNSSQEIKLLPNNQIWAASGVQLSQLIDFSLNNGLIGLETFAYIPSTLGAAIAGNIHGTKYHFSTITKSIESLNLPQPIILSAILQLKNGDTQKAKEIAKDIIQTKSLVQPMNSLGSIFINPSVNHTAGQIIDKELKLKGLSIGDAQISPSHANFIVNNGHATAKDYLSLIKLIQDTAKKSLNLDLELEIKLLGQI